MATDISTEYTLAEVLRHNGPDGLPLHVVDVLAERLPMVEEGYWVQANDDTSHEFMRSNTQPSGTPTRYNEGAPYETGLDVPVKEDIMRLESNLRIDTRILDKARDPVGYRIERERRQTRGMVKSFHNILFSKPYATRGTALPAKEVKGLGLRYNALDPTKNVVSLGGSGSGVLGSIWLIKHGLDGMFFIHPKTMDRTLQVKDMKVQKQTDANGNPWWAVETNFAWEFGFGIGDEYKVQRICNIAASGTGSFFDDGTTPQVGEYALIDAIERMGGPEGVVIYAGPTVVGQIRKRLNDKSNMYWTMDTVWGRRLPMFMECPIITVETLAMDESTIS